MRVDLDLRATTTVPLRRGFEYAIVLMSGAVGINGQLVRPGRLGHLGRGRDELRLEVREPTRAVLLGGEPFEEPIFRWWNFVGRTRAEIDAVCASWAAQDDRFGRVRSALALIPAEAPFWQ